MNLVKVVGVPEYFNLPIHLAIENGAFERAGIKVLWQDVSQGTGRMAQMLADNEVDLAIILTEGITKAIVQGNPARIVHTYVESPLIWGIHTSSHSSIDNLQDLNEIKFAISRLGSGSHLMGILLAQSLGQSTQNLHFKIVDNLEGARKALASDPFLVFLWEKFTTKFLVDNGEFRRIGDWPTPWPCFVIAASEKAIKEKPIEIQSFLSTLLAEIQRCINDPSFQNLICKRYDLNQDDVREFHPNTKWNTTFKLPKQAVEKVLSTFWDLEMISENESKAEVFAVF